MHRYSQPNTLNHLKEFIDTGKEQQFSKANDADCILWSFQGFSPPFPTLPYFPLEQLSTLKTCQKFGKQQAISYFFSPEAMIWFCANLKQWAFQMRLILLIQKWEDLSNNEYFCLLGLQA